MNALRSRNLAFQEERSTYAGPEVEASSLSVRGTRVRVMHTRSPWMAELRDRFDDILSLPLGWDGYKGRPVSFTCAQFAANLIERLYIDGVAAPQLVPGSDGTVQIEWHQNQFDVEIDVLGPYEVNAIRRNLRNGDIEELELQTDFTALSDWVSALNETVLVQMRARA